MEGLEKCPCGCGRFVTKKEAKRIKDENIVHVLR